MIVRLNNYDVVTAGRNGYPVPETGVAVYADTWEKLTDIASRTGGYVHEFHRRDGWMMVEDKGQVLYPETYKEETIADLAEELDGDVINLADWDKADWLEWEQARLGADFDANKWNALADEIQELQQDTCTAAVQVYDGECHADFCNMDMGYNYDTHQYRLGVYLSKKEWLINYADETALKIKD